MITKSFYMSLHYVTLDKSLLCFSVNAIYTLDLLLVVLSIVKYNITNYKLY